MWAVPLEPMLISTGHAGVAFRTRLFVTILYVVALAPLVHQMGLLGGGVASVAASALMAGGMLVGVMRWYRDPGVRLTAAALAAQKSAS
jgi:O-antigen/teichoic acid export membrane protein